MSTLEESTRPAYQRPPAGTLFLIGALYVATGIFYTMASVPDLFTVLARNEVGPSYVDVSWVFLRDTAKTWSSLLTTVSFNGFGRLCLQIALFALPVLWLSALARSARAQSWRPFQITALASALGLIGIPILTWIGWLLYKAWWLGGHIVDFLRWVSPWIVRVALWVAVAAAIAWIAWSGYRLIVWLLRERRWIGVLVGALIVAAVVGVVAAGWLDGVLAAIGHVIGAVWSGLVAGIEWIVRLIAPVLSAVFGFVARVILFTVIFLLSAGFIIGSFGQMGRTVCLPFPAAVKAGAAQGKCADFAAGAGVAWSLLLTATVLDPAFRTWFTTTWETTPVVAFLPVPTGVFEFLIPGSAEALLRPAFTGFSPFLDVALLLLLTVIGMLSLLFSGAAWTLGTPARLVMPVMIAVGLAISTAMLVLLLMVWAKSQSGD